MVSATPSAGAQRQLDTLGRSQPETGPWLGLVAEAMREADDPGWDRAAAGTALRPEQPGSVPLLTGAVVPLDARSADGWVRRILALAAEAGPDAAQLGEVAASDRLDARRLIESAVAQDASALTAQALAVGVDADALAAVAQLAAGPLLQACRRRFAAAVPGDWNEGCCPLCGAWPALAESRGLDRARRLRCARCGADWAGVVLRCPFCRNADHQTLGSLVAEGEGEARKVDTCDRCRGYLKSVATLRPWAADEVALADLATVDLDLAALDRDFARPAAPAVALHLSLVDPPAADPLGDGP